MLKPDFFGKCLRLTANGDRRPEERRREEDREGNLGEASVRVGYETGEGKGGNGERYAVSG